MFVLIRTAAWRSAGTISCLYISLFLIQNCLYIFIYPVNYSQTCTICAEEIHICCYKIKKILNLKIPILNYASLLI